MRLTPEAVALVRRSLELANLNPASAGVRVREAGGELRPRFVASPEPTDEIVEADGVRVFVDPRLAASRPEAVIGVSHEHERLVLLDG
jgi:Fe-S cluster assembly iron-binding protein IscA